MEHQPHQGRTLNPAQKQKTNETEYKFTIATAIAEELESCCKEIKRLLNRLSINLSKAKREILGGQNQLSRLITNRFRALRNEIINSYLSFASNNVTHRKWDISKAPGDEIVKLLEVRLTDQNNNSIDSIDFYKGGNIEYTYQILKEGYHPIPNIHLFNQNGEYILVSTADSNDSFKTIGKYTTKAELPYHLLNDRRYIVGVAISTLLPHIVHFYEQDALKFEVIENMEYRNTDYRGIMPGTIRPLLKWQIEKIN